jgi:hypothetical protein
LQHLLGVVGVKAIGVGTLEQIAGHGAKHDRKLFLVDPSEVGDRRTEGFPVSGSGGRYCRIDSHGQPAR